MQGNLTNKYIDQLSKQKDKITRKQGKFRLYNNKTCNNYEYYEVTNIYASKMP